MDHRDHVRLLRDGVPASVGRWADLGAGEGAFTLALAELLPEGSSIIAIDRDPAALRALEAAHTRMALARSLAPVETRVADLTGDLGLGPLDGIVMANSLHFVREKRPVLGRVRALLRPGAPLLLVEYDTDDGNTWVPFPLSFETWRRLAVTQGFSEPVLLETVRSRFLRRIYAARCDRV